MKKTLLAALFGVMVFGASTHSEANPSWGPYGTFSGYYGNWLYPGQNFRVGSFINGWGQAYCGLAITSIDMDSSANGYQGYASLALNNQNHSTQFVPYNNGYLSRVRMQTQGFNNIICYDLKLLEMWNTGQSPIWIGNLYLQWQNTPYGGGGPTPPPPPPPPPTGTYRDVWCASSGDLEKCYVGQNAYDAQLISQASSKPCIEGQTWAYSNQYKEIWVSKGCSGTFRVYIK